MSHTKDLLNLVEVFPQAFAPPEDRHHGQEFSANLTEDDLSVGATHPLLQLIQEFPQAFVDPGAVEPLLETEAAKDSPESLPPVTQAAQTSPTEPDLPENHLPSGYAHALQRRVQTLTWGQVNFNLVYGEEGLAELWVTVGKSGTEVQSLCEAIARLVNLLLLNHVSIPEIVRQIRGIRGADSEGLGPNRILGLADLIGKVLQEAPGGRWPQPFPSKGSPSPGTLPHQRGATPTTQSHDLNLPQPDPTATQSPTVTATTQRSVSSNGSSHSSLQDQKDKESGRSPSPQRGALPPAHFRRVSGASVEALPGGIVSASLCPDCGAELNQVNGCKGGACLVCGYSSCS